MQQITGGRVWSEAGDDPDVTLSHLAGLLRPQAELHVFSRRSPRRIEGLRLAPRPHIRWLTERLHDAAITPSLEHLFAACDRIIGSGSGLIWIEGIGVLAHLQGFESTLKFIRRLVDVVRTSDHSVILVIDPLTLEESELARVRREASPLPAYGSVATDVIPTVVDMVRAIGRSAPKIIADIGNGDQVIPSPADIALSRIEPAEPALAPVSTIVGRDAGLAFDLPPLLSRLPPNALDAALLERRADQWRAQGFDVSRMDLALKLEGQERGLVYVEVEDSVRRAVDCLRQIIRLERPRFTTTIAKLTFRAFQLTALDSVEMELNELEEAGHL